MCCEVLLKKCIVGTITGRKNTDVFTTNGYIFFFSFLSHQKWKRLCRLWINQSSSSISALPCSLEDADDFFVSCRINSTWHLHLIRELIKPMLFFKDASVLLFGVNMWNPRYISSLRIELEAEEGAWRKHAKRKWKRNGQMLQCLVVLCSIPKYCRLSHLTALINFANEESVI